MKPTKVKFCWDCGKKLRPRYFTRLFIYGYNRILHKQCAKYQEKMIRIFNK